MLTIRRASERGHADHGWLDSHHTFSFADYHDPAHMGFRALRVINEDRVQPGGGFGTHPHRDMEIISWVISGQLSHQDSMGNGSVIRPGDVQRMTAGTGVLHSEKNPSMTEPVHFLQIWLLPHVRGLPPGYEQKTFEPDARRGRLALVASPDGRAGALTLHSDASLLAGTLASGETASHALAAGRAAWVHVISGAIDVNGLHLAAGDAAALTEGDVALTGGGGGGDVLLFDLA